ncbi:MAG: response regulator, partial [Thermodesulfovibrionales bacterium]|nr:response regulator [Thermodesulfovibrionales bacterium]
EFTDDTYDFVKVQTGALDSLLSKIEETVAFKGFVNDNKQRIASVMQKVKILSKDVDILGSYIHDDFKKILNSINEDLSSILLRDIVFEGFVSNQIDDIIYEIKNISMLPLKDIFEPLPRMVRDLAMSQGKKINIIFEGIEARVDKRIMEGLRDPIMHIIRNAVDHGIETPDERKQVGKPEIGNIKIRATIETGKKLTLEIIDDGRGIDIHNLRNKLIELGILTSQQSNNIDDSDIIQYIFRPEVSTSKEVTHISGRGLGLSIANEAAERLGGFIKVYTEANKGSVFVFNVPLYVTNLKIILFKTSNGTTYGIPTNNVEAVKRFVIDDIQTHEGKEIIQYNEMPISLIPIETVLQMPYDANTDDKYFVALIIRHSEKIVAFRIKEILHEEEISLKDFGYIIKRVKNFSGCATVKSGETILILNPSDLMKSALNTAVIRSIQQTTKTPEIKKKSILLVEDSITARTLFKNILESAGFLVTTAVDGIDALATLKTDNFDLVVTDVQMPRMDGFELTAKIRADANLFRLPVVLVTGLETRQDKERGMEVGANAYIVKSSFDQSNLIEVINRLI